VLEEDILSAPIMLAGGRRSHVHSYLEPGKLCCAVETRFVAPSSGLSCPLILSSPPSRQSGFLVLHV
jgi:hypothetical protein